MFNVLPHSGVTPTLWYIIQRFLWWLRSHINGYSFFCKNYSCFSPTIIIVTNLTLLQNINKGFRWPGSSNIYWVQFSLSQVYAKALPGVAAAAAAKSLQSCLTLCDPIDGSPRGSPVPGILQARTLEWVAISFSNAWKWKVKLKGKSLSPVWLFVTPGTAAYQAPLSMGFSRQEYWSGLSLPSLTRGRNAVKGQKGNKMEDTLQRKLVLVTSGISELFGQHIEWG